MEGNSLVDHIITAGGNKKNLSTDKLYVSTIIKEYCPFHRL